MYKYMGITTSFKSRAVISAVFCLLFAVSLFAVSSSRAQTYINGYDLQWQQLTTQWNKANAPSKAVLLYRIYELREFVTDSGIVAKKLTAIAEDWDEPVLVRDEANWRRAQIALHEGRFDESRRLTDALGFVRDWVLTGSPTCLPLNSGNTTAVRPSPLGTLSLHGITGTACVGTSIYSAKTQNVALRFAANVPVTVFVNGTTIDSVIPAALAFDQRSVGVSLQQGWNVIALELGSHTEARQFALRISAPEGSGLPLISDSSRINSTAVGTAKVPVADLLKFAEQLTSPGTLETTALLRETHGLVGRETSGLASPQITELKELEAIRPTSIWVKRELALRYEANGSNGQAASLLNQVWKTSLDDVHVRAALQRLAEKRGDADMLRMLAQLAELLDPMDPDAQRQLAKFDAAATGDNDRTESPVARVRLADLLTFIGSQEAAGSQPIAAIQQDDLPSSNLAADNEFLVDASALAKETRQNAVKEQGNIVTLADVNIERLRANGQSTIHAQQVFYVGNQRGARDYSIRSIHYSHATQKLTVLAARVHKADGRVLQAEDQGETSVADTSVAMYYDTRARSFRFPTLEKGDTIELEYRIAPNSNRNPYGNYFGTLIAFQNGLSQRLRRYVLVVPAKLKLNVVEERMPVRAAVSEIGDQITYRWDAVNIAPLATEPRGPSLTEAAPYVTASTFADWDQLGKWYANLITPQFSLDGELLEQVQKITANLTTEKEKIHAIHEFVLRNTNYLAMEFGVYSYKPYTVTQTYARRSGDCKDKAALMIAMLHAVGVDAEFALVRTRKLGDVSDRATNIAVFNHAVAYIPKYDLWLDGTAEYAGLRELPLDDQGAMALTVNLNGNATLRRIPVTLPMQNYTHRVVRAEVRKDGNIFFNGSAYTRGEDAPGLRREYEIADRQRDTVRANLAQVYPSVQVDSVMVDGAHDIERDIHVQFSGSLKKFAGQKQLTLVSSWLPHQYVNSLAALKSRTQQLQLPAPWTTEEEIHFVIPENGKVDNVPDNVRMETPFGTAVIRYERRNREIVVSTSVQFSKLRIEPSEYAQFRQFCADVEKAFRKEIKVRLGS